jgi:hypothetical protein
MPYTLTMTALWMALAAGLGAVAGYLFRGRTPAQRARSRRGAVADVPDHERETREVDRLRAEVERLSTQLAVTRTERDRLRVGGSTPERPKPSRTKPSRTKPSRTKPSRTKPSRTRARTSPPPGPPT